MNTNEELLPLFNRFRQRAMIVGVAGVAALAAGALMSQADFFQSYLFGYLFWMGLTLGCLGILILHHLVSGSWGHVVQRYVESGARTLPYMALMFIPIIIGMHELYPWTNHEGLEHVVEKKLGYLNVPFFLVRQVLYFGFWLLVAYWLSKNSRLQDQNGDVRLTRKMKIFSGPSMVFFVITVTLASVDWMMSLEPEWYSTMYGVGRIVGAVLTALAFCIVLVRWLGDKQPLAGILTTRHLHHLGNLLMAFTVLWAYIAFSEFLIIWSGNLPEDNMWHIRRMNSEWSVFAVVLIAGHFAVPFALLLSRRLKRHIVPLARIAVGILVMRFVDLYWLVYPAFNNHELHFHWLSLAAPAAIGGVWLWLFIGHLKSSPLLPLNDPRFHNGVAEQH
ncbi:MAG: hypothetical protein KF749_15815 [Bacteroidetes bacterium]|nr:hypothetical protein [Bacteroidota bacterium]MCW5897345.1 hypothetical protein [Bacteroidota bacterium]